MGWEDPRHGEDLMEHREMSEGYWAHSIYERLKWHVVWRLGISCIIEKRAKTKDMIVPMFLHIHLLLEIG